LEYTLFNETFKELKALARNHKRVAVSYSGGKDSLVCLDMASKVFDKVVAVFFYLVPGLDMIERQLQVARERYGVEILEYPHWVLSRCIKNGIYCDVNWKTSDAIWEYNSNDLYKAVCHDANVRHIIHGGKNSDSFWRRITISTISADCIVYPLKKWKKFDVLSYLKIHNVPIPPSFDGVGSRATGVDLSTGSILWMHDKYPDDYEKIRNVFPYVEAVVKRRDWYGVG